jgi:hypothetical protein
MLGVTSPLFAKEAHHHEHDHHHAVIEAHVHGEAELNIVIDGNEVLVAFISPLENLLGFEHKPETHEQQHAYDDLQTQLNSYEALIDVVDAECKQIDVHAEEPYSDRHDSHAEWHAEYHLNCDRFTAIKPVLFSNYPGIEKLTVQLISEQGQSQFIVHSAEDLISVK